MSSWKDIQRHPLSAEYRDITGPAWFAFILGIKANGILGGRKIVLHEGMVLDGWQLFRACIETNTEPEFEPLADGIDPRVYVETMNDKRRHETSEERSSRLERVINARAEGKSTRTIAAEEGISQKQVMRDLEKSTESGGDSVEPPDGKVIGKDKKKRDAKAKKPRRKKVVDRCSRCTRMFPDPQTISIRGCPQCKAIKEQKPPDSEPEKVVDDAGTVVPMRLLEVFKTVPLFKEAERLFDKASKVCKEIENSKGVKNLTPLEGSKHYGELFGALKNSRYRIRAMRPALVCPDCQGEACEKCDDGVLTKERADKLEVK